MLVVSLLASAFIYYSVQEFSLQEFDISDLQWYKGNPDGFLLATIGPMIAMLLVLPNTRYFLRRYERPARRTAMTGSILLEITVMVFVANAILSAFESDDWMLHGILARTSFALFILSNVVLLHAARAHDREESTTGAHITKTLLVLTHISLVIIMVIFIGPHLVDYNYPQEWVGLNPYTILGSCEILYLMLGYTTLLWLTRKLPAHTQRSSVQ